jgi:cbb3-type cytochrome oxidase maturation protein
MSLTWFLFVLAVLLGIAAWMVFVWSVKTGQLDDADATAARMLELEEEDLAEGGTR